MKNVYKIFVLVLFVVISGCKEKNIVMSAVQDGEELKEGSIIYFTLYQNFPNNFEYTTYIKFSVYKRMNLKMSVYTEDWELVKVLFDKWREPGHYEIVFEAKNSDGNWLPSGNYYYSLEGEGLTLTHSMKLLK